MKSKKDIAELMQRIFKELDETREAGQKEYAHDSENAFANFERLSVELGIPREVVLWVYTRKHLDGIVSYLKGHKSQREDVRGRIKDIIVYLILLWGMVDDNEENGRNEKQENSIIKSLMFKYDPMGNTAQEKAAFDTLYAGGKLTSIEK